LKKVSIVPVYISGSGKESIGSVADSYEFGKGRVTSVCGNGILETGETCDDGNTVSDDGCSNTCQMENDEAVCGNDGCSNTCQTEITGCDLTSAGWSATNVVEGTNVNLNVHGTNCNGKTISFVVKEDDFVGSNDVNINPVNVVFSGTTATGTWTAEYQTDVSGDPEYYFIATVVGESENIESGKSDTELLHVSESVIGNGFRANEPAGMTTISDRPFNQADEDGWTGAAVQNQDNYDNVDDEGALHSPTKAAQYTYPKDFVSGFSPANPSQTKSFSAGTTKVYIQIYFKVSSNWQCHPSRTNKMGFVWIDGSPMVVYKTRGTTPDNPDATMLFGAGLQDLGMSESRHLLIPNLGNDEEVVRGQWHNAEFIIESNTPGVLDGKFESWLDGVKQASYSDIGFVDTGTSNDLEFVSIHPIWGGEDGVVTEEMYYYIDHMYVSEGTKDGTLYPNEPDGFTTIAEDGLTALPGPPTWYLANSKGLMTMVEDSDAPVSGPEVIDFLYPENMSAGVGAGAFYYRGPNDDTEFDVDYEEFYTSVHVKLVGPDWEMAPAQLKLWYVAYGNHLTHNNGFIGPSAATGQILSHATIRVVLSNGIWPNAGWYGGTFRVGQWHHLETYLKHSDVNVANGLLKQWIDGDLVIDRNDILTRTDMTHDPPPWKGVDHARGYYDWQFTPIYGGKNHNKTRDDHMRLDHVYISGKGSI
jgi:cysteine-rich repeat protein